MAQDFVLTPSTHLDLTTLDQLLRTKARVVLGEEARQRITECHQYLQNRLERTPEAVVYGINTGFGALCGQVIAPGQRQQLQTNLLMSHACGTGEEVPAELVRLMLLLKVQSLSYGHSGVQLATVQRLLDFYNRGMLPVVYQQGSLGASGDLAPLAHLCLPLLGLGEVHYEGYRLAAADAMSLFSWQPLTLEAKEGLALLNGTQFMLAYAVHGLLRARHLLRAADYIGALSLEAFDGRSEPFDERLHRIRPHAGQLAVAGRIRELLASSELQNQPKTAVQDPYSFRCMPQVHGASHDALAYVQQVVETECNAVTDNPNIFPEDDAILSGGNFHGQPLALALDMLAIATAELGSISQQRTTQLIGGQRGLPPFLVAEPGLNSGLMIPQYTAAGVVSQNKQLCTPASVDSVVSSNGQEDHVSMGANAATKALRVVQNVEQLLGIELLNATQALEFRRPARTSEPLEQLVTAFREKVAFVSQDRVLYPDLHAAAAFVRAYEFGE
jgi:histidine ammonia-lyase